MSMLTLVVKPKKTISLENFLLENIKDIIRSFNLKVIEVGNDENNIEIMYNMFKNLILSDCTISGKDLIKGENYIIDVKLIDPKNHVSPFVINVEYINDKFETDEVEILKINDQQDLW